MSEKATYWFNLKTKQVEHGLKSSSLDRVGPFETEQEAQGAEETIRLRAQKWREQEEGEN
jgi:hypothetical protein